MLENVLKFSSKVLLLFIGVSISCPLLAAPSRVETEQYIEQLVDKYCSSSPRKFVKINLSSGKFSATYSIAVWVYIQRGRFHKESAPNEIVLKRSYDSVEVMLNAFKGIFDQEYFHDGRKRSDKKIDSVTVCTIVDTKEGVVIAQKLAKALQHYSSFYGEPIAISNKLNSVSEDLF